MLTVQHIASVNKCEAKIIQSSVITAMSELPILNKLIEMLNLIAELIL